LDDYIRSQLCGRRILIVEDDYFQAQDLTELMQAKGAEVVGPVPSVDKGMSLLLNDTLPDMAILDVRLGEETVYPLVEALKTLSIPFVFATANPDWTMPEPYEGLPHVEKPIDERELLRVLTALSWAC
jgi:two-component SAPR family response regulator